MSLYTKSGLKHQKMVAKSQCNVSLMLYSQQSFFLVWLEYYIVKPDKTQTYIFLYIFLRACIIF